MTRHAAPTVGRLLDHARAAALVDAFAALAAGGSISLVDPDGTLVAGDAPGPAGTVTRELRTRDGAVVGAVVGGAPVPDAVLHALATAVEVLLVEVEDRRSVALDALERYRELALLSRISGTVGGAADPSGIVTELVAEAGRVLRSDVALVVPRDPATIPPAAAGGARSISRIRAAVVPLLDDLLVAEAPRTISDDALSLLVAPIRGADGLDAALVLGRESEPAFDAPDERIAGTLAGHAAQALERAHFAALDAARRELEQEVRLGRRIQRSLLPQRAPDVPGWTFGTHYEPARQVGGDFYDVFRMRDLPGSVGLVIADVTGKGIAAALLMAFARPLLRAITDQYRDPAAALTQANRMLVVERPTPLFITAFIGVLDAATGVLRYASAGHEPPLLAPAGARRVRRLAEGGALLGAFPTISPGDHLTQLQPGDLLLLHTDGAIDARDPAGRRFGDLRLARTVGASRGLAADALVQRVADAVLRFSAGTPPADDIALLAVGRDAA